MMKAKALRRYWELWSKITDLIKSLTNNPDDYEKYMKMRSNSDEELPLKKMVTLHNMIIVVKSIFHEDSKYYQQVYLYEYLYKL